MGLRFITFMGFRYFRSRRRSAGAASTVLSVLGVAVGVMTLTAVLGVMNGFQLGFIESILEISSYHLQVNCPQGGSPGEQTLARLRSLPGLRAVVPFSEHQVIIEGRYTQARGCQIRALPAEAADLDPGFADRLQMVAGAFDLARPGGIILGAELARHLGVAPGDSVSILALEGKSFSALRPLKSLYQVAGLFKSGYYEFDLGWAFISSREAASLDPQARTAIGIKIENRFRDQAAAEAVRRALDDPLYRVGSWREFNRAFFGALRMEKIMMMLLIGLIFVVVGFNIYHSLRRVVRERHEEIGVLKALGASDGELCQVFVLDGLLIGLLGGFFGILLGLLISANVNAVFAAAEMLVNGLLELFNRLLFPLMGRPGERFSLFSPAYFYISEVPSRVLPQEAVMIVLFALFSPTVAAAAAAARLGRIRPAEVLRYE